MIDQDNFREWLKANTTYTDASIGDAVSRMKRADSILEWDGSDTYLFYLEQEPVFRKLSISVRSQMRRAVRQYTAFSKRRKK